MRMILTYSYFTFVFDLRSFVSCILNLTSCRICMKWSEFLLFFPNEVVGYLFGILTFLQRSEGRWDLMFAIIHYFSILWSDYFLSKRKSFLKRNLSLHFWNSSKVFHNRFSNIRPRDLSGSMPLLNNNSWEWFMDDFLPCWTKKSWDDFD